MGLFYRLVEELNCFHSSTLFMPQFLKNPAKPPWQEKLAAWLVMGRRKTLPIDIERIVFRPNDFLQKSAVYRIFVCIHAPLAVHACNGFGTDL